MKQMSDTEVDLISACEDHSTNAALTLCQKNSFIRITIVAKIIFIEDK
jgi:hypothetical protein